MIFQNNKQLIDELKKIIKKSGKQQKELAKILDIPEQVFSRWLKKKNFSFEDCNKLLSIINYKLEIDFIAEQEKKSIDIDEQSKVLLLLYSQLSDLQKAEIKGIIKGMLR